LQKQIESGAVDVHTQALLVDSYLNKNAENEMLRQQIIEEVKAKMLRDKEDQRYKNEEIVQQLNMQRLKFLEAEQLINEKKLLHSEVMKRGVDFLAEIELGKVPPLEYAVRSIQGNSLNTTIDSTSLPSQVSKFNSE
jgi:hypothetical protein